jgi:hypothetical protein
MTGMEALAAVGLASNVVQFADFATRLVVAARNLYKSVEGTTAENKELEMLAQNLRDLAKTENLLQLAENTQYNGLTPSHAALSSLDSETWRNLNKQCIDVADDLIKLLQSLKVKGDLRSGESMYRALRNAWKREDIESLQARLDRISDQLYNGIRERQQRQITKQLDQLAMENARLETTRAREIHELKHDFARSFTAIQEGFRKEGRLTRAWLQLPVVAERGKGLVFEQCFLNDLRFNSIDYRHTAISKEHANTLQWIFDQTLPRNVSQPSVNFVQWLKGNHGPFWITGKPGSGKSTLMKFISSHNVTLGHLKAWAGPRKLVTASFYFWSAAKDSMQKSQVGLLRSILYQILRQCPEWIPIAFPNSRENFETEIHPEFGFSTAPALLGAFKRISDSPLAPKANFAFFIDGLDEYDGRPTDIIDLMELLRNSPQIKICVSSRPWNEFDASFGVVNPWKLYIHDLTKNDIRLYVQETLGKDRNFRDLRDTDDRCPDLVEQIVNSAEGVFLWVFLAVRSLLEGLTNADRVVDLQNRLREIPTDLETYFERILSTVDRRYRQQMSHTFIVTLEAHQNLPLLCYWYMDEDDSENIFRLEVRPTMSKTVESRINQMQKRLNARCKGLLEARLQPDPDDPTRAFSYQVDFLHRTVRDFLAIASMQRLLRTWASKSHDVDLNICNSIIAIVKGAPPLIPAKYAQNLTETFFHHVKNLEQQNLSQKFQLRLVDEFAATLRARGIDATVLTRNQPVGRAAVSRWGAKIGLFHECICANAVLYIEQEIKKQPALVQEEGPTLLAMALVPTTENFEWGCERFDVLEMLLRNGADPNMTILQYDSSRWNTNGGSAWTVYLKKLGQTYATGQSRLHNKSTTTYQCLKSLLTYGANPNDSRLGEAATGSATRIGRLQDAFTEDQWNVLQDIMGQEKDRTTGRMKSIRFLHN